MLIAVELRVLKGWALDEITEIVNPIEPEKLRSLKEYGSGYLHLDATYLPKINGIKYCLFVAIDRITRTLYYKIYDAKKVKIRKALCLSVSIFFPFGITHVLTDNGLEFTNRLLKDKTGKYCAK